MNKTRYVCFATRKGTFAVPADAVEALLGLEENLDDKLLVQAVDYLPRKDFKTLLEHAVVVKTGRLSREYIPYVAYF